MKKIVIGLLLLAPSSITLHGMHEIKTIHETSTIKYVGFSNDSSLVYANKYFVKKHDLHKEETETLDNGLFAIIDDFGPSLGINPICGDAENIFFFKYTLHGITPHNNLALSGLERINRCVGNKKINGIACNNATQQLVVGMLDKNDFSICTSNYKGDVITSSGTIAQECDDYGNKPTLNMALNAPKNEIILCNRSKLIRYNSKKNRHDTFVQSKDHSLFHTICIDPTYVFLAALTTNLSNKNPKIKLWNLQKGKGLFALPLPQETSGTTLAFTKNADFVICGLANGTVQFWPTAAQHDKPIYSCSIAQDPITHIALDKSGERLAVAHKNSITIKNINQLLATVLASPLKAHHALQKMRTQQQLTDIIIQHK